LLIHCYLFSPKGDIRFRHKISIAAVSVPEAAINKNSDSCAGPDEVRFAEKVRVPSPSLNSVSSEEFCGEEFGGFVSATSNP
jgi:hypothetical protein